MALSYTESAQLMQDLTFQNRIKVACLKFAEYIDGEATDTPAHNTRMKWAATVIQNPQQQASNIQPPVVMDPAVQEQGPTISDAELQTAVETTVNHLL